MKRLRQLIASNERQIKELAKEVKDLSTKLNIKAKNVTAKELKKRETIKEKELELNVVKGVNANLLLLLNKAADQGLEFFEANKVQSHYNVSFLDRKEKVFKVYDINYKGIRNYEAIKY